MVDNSETPEIFPGFELMGLSTCASTGRCSRVLVRFFCTDASGRQVGQDFNRTFDSLMFLTFMFSPQRHTALALESLESSAAPLQGDIQ